MKKLMLLSLILPVLLFVGCIGPGPGPGPVEEEYPIKFTVVEKRSWSGITEKDYVVVNSKEEWELLYKKIHSTDSLEEMPGIPYIDFEEFTVIAVFMGEQPSQDYKISVERVTGVTGINKYIKVFVQERVPGENIVVEYDPVQPYEIIKMKKTDLDVKVIRNVIHVIPVYPEDEVDFSMIEKGARSAIKEKKGVVVNTLKEWTELYQEIHSDEIGSIGVEPEELIQPIPYVDFDKYTVIGVFAGEKPNPNYGVEINKIVKTKSSLTVYVHEVYNKPSPGTSTTPVTVQPYEVVKIKKTELPVNFKWKEIIIVPVTT